MRRRSDIDGYRFGPLLGLTAMALLLGLFAVLPMGHQLFHEPGSEPETCPVHLLEGRLLLLAVVFLAVALALSTAQRRVAILASVPLPLFHCSFCRPARAPPRT